jgi:hypothetical protein
MSPSKYEIPSGSTYGYLIADNAAKVEMHQSILFPTTTPEFLRRETIWVQTLLQSIFEMLPPDILPQVEEVSRHGWKQLREEKKELYGDEVIQKIVRK